MYGHGKLSSGTHRNAKSKRINNNTQIVALYIQDQKILYKDMQLFTLKVDQIHTAGLFSVTELYSRL
jgi:hypothetical protein